MKNKEKDYIMRTVGCQTVVSLIILGTVFCISKTNTELLSKLSDDLLPLITITLTKEDTDDAFKDIREILYSDNLFTDDTVNDDETGDSQSVDNTGNTDDSQKSENTAASDNQQDTDVTNAAEDTEDIKGNTDGDVDAANPELTNDLTEGELIAVVKESKYTKLVNLSITRDGVEIPATASTLSYTLNRSIYNPLEGKVTDSFGERIHPVYNTESFHTGIDIAADTGELIRSIADGTVIRASYDQWNGNYLEIDHGNGITTMYCHCSELLCKVGTVVRGGEAVAKVGSTGVSTGPHLHFEFRIDGISYDPAYALSYATDAV